MHRLRWFLLPALLLALAACGKASKEDLLKKAESVKTRAQLEKALGRPDDIAKVGPIETWTYKAGNGEVIFVLTGDTVALQATGNSKN